MNDLHAIAAADWLRGQLGQRVYALEHKLTGEALAQVFGWQLLQIGVWGDQHRLMEGARTQRKAVLARDGLDGMADADGTSRVMSLRSRTDSLAVASDSVDAVLLPHTLEYEADPHGLLREVERILLGDGQLIVMGFRPFSSWGVRHVLTRQGFPPGARQLIGEMRLRDWLKLLGFEVIDARRYLFTWPWGATAPRSERFLELAGDRVWPLFAGAYMIKARKRVYTLTPIRPRWRTPKKVMGGLIEPTSRVKTNRNS